MFQWSLSMKSQLHVNRSGLRGFDSKIKIVNICGSIIITDSILQLRSLPFMQF